MNQRFWWGLTAFILCGSAGSFAYSQTADAQADEGELEAVIVSAQRRSENLQAVPITVSSISEASLQQDSITDTSALVAVSVRRVLNSVRIAAASECEAETAALPNGATKIKSPAWLAL